MMRIERHDDPARFFALVAPFLERREAEHNLQLGFRPGWRATATRTGPRSRCSTPRSTTREMWRP